METDDDWNPDWDLSLTEKLACTLSIALSKHVPDWKGATDEQLDQVADAILKRIRREYSLRELMSDAEVDECVEAIMAAGKAATN